MNYFIFFITLFLASNLLASELLDDHFELLDARAKLIDIGWAYQHHQSDFRIPEDCIGNHDLYNQCHRRLTEQDRSILEFFIMDSLLYLAPNINDFLVTMEFSFEEIREKFSEAEDTYEKLSKIDCDLAYYCRLGSYCGQGDYGVLPSCIAESESKRVDYLSRVINEGFAGSLKVIDSELTLNTESFTINISGACIPPAIGCSELKYFGQSKKNNSSISLKGVPYYGRDKERRNVQFLGYYFKSGSIEYYVSLEGVLKVNDLKGNKILLEEEGTWRITP